MLNFLQVDDVGVVAQLLQNGNFTDGRAWDSIIAMVDLDLFNRYYFLCCLFNGLEYHTVGTLAKFTHVLESLYKLLWRLDGTIISTACAPLGLALLFCLLLAGWRWLIRSHGNLGNCHRWLSLVSGLFSLNHGNVFSIVLHIVVNFSVGCACSANLKVYVFCYN